MWCRVCEAVRGGWGRMTQTVERVDGREVEGWRREGGGGRVEEEEGAEWERGECAGWIGEDRNEEREGDTRVGELVDRGNCARNCAALVGDRPPRQLVWEARPSTVAHLVAHQHRVRGSSDGGDQCEAQCEGEEALHGTQGQQS